MTTGMTRAQSLRFAAESIAGLHAIDALDDATLWFGFAACERIRGTPRKGADGLYRRADDLAWNAPIERGGKPATKAPPKRTDAWRRAVNRERFKDLMPRQA